MLHWYYNNLFSAPSCRLSRVPAYRRAIFKIKRPKYWLFSSAKGGKYRFGVFCPAVQMSVTKLFGLYLKDYDRFEHETSGVYRSHWGEVYCTRTITLYFLILELLPFVFYTLNMVYCVCKLLNNGSYLIVVIKPIKHN